MQFIFCVKINNSDGNIIISTGKVFKRFPKISDECRMSN